MKNKFLLFLFCFVICNYSISEDFDILKKYEKIAKENKNFQNFSSENGKILYFKEFPKPVLGFVSCASCHLKDPRRSVLRHRTKVLCRACHVIDESEHPNPIDAKKRFYEAFAPVANNNRFNNFEHTELWFKYNCNFVYSRDCTVQEKGDILSWLFSLKESTKDNIPFLQNKIGYSCDIKDICGEYYSE